MYGYNNKNVITNKSLNNTSLSSVILVDSQYWPRKEKENP